jgi:D-galactarolactone isomerase
MVEPLSNWVTELGWHIQINAPAAKIMEIMPILERVRSPIVFDHLAHIPEPEGINHPLFAQIRVLLDKGRTWVKLSGAHADTRSGRRPTPIRPRSRRLMSRHHPSGLSWAATGRTRANERASLTTPYRSICCWLGAPDEAVRHRILVENPAICCDYPKSA